MTDSIEPTKERIQKMKDALEKQHGREFTWEEATQGVRDLMKLARIQFDVIKEDSRRQKLLEASPKGFHFDRKGYACLICGASASEENSWFDKYGLKCITCQAAVNKKIIPGSVCRNKESWYSKYELERYFNLKGSVLNKYIKQGLLKDRVIPGEAKKVYLQLFLIKDNKDVLPPKKFLKSRRVTVTRNGEQYYTQEDWYEFLDVTHAKRLSKYRIVECFKETFALPIRTGRLLYKQVNPIFSSKD